MWPVRVVQSVEALGLPSVDNSTWASGKLDPRAMLAKRLAGIALKS